MRDRRAAAGLMVIAVAAWVFVACGSTAQRSATTGAPTTTSATGGSTTGSPRKPSSRVPAEVARTVARLKAGEKPGGTNSTFSDSAVPVRDDGKLQLEFHAIGPVTEAEKADLTALGAEIVASGSAAGIVDAWVAFTRVDEAAGLPWVVAVTVPSPTRRS